MRTVDNLPPDQRAVLQLVLQRGRSYDEIARLLSIDRAAVRQRALDALASLASDESDTAHERALITDYLLGQLPERVAEQVLGYLASSPADREWALTVSSKLQAMTSGPLPEIPGGGEAESEPEAAPAAGEEPREPAPASEGAPAPAAVSVGVVAPRVVRPAASTLRPAPRVVKPAPARASSPESASARVRGGSRRGGAVLLALLAIAVIAVIVVLVAAGNSSHHRHARLGASTPAVSNPVTSSTPATASTTTPAAKPKLLAALNLTSPSGAGNTVGVAQVIRESGVTGIVIDAQGIPPNGAHNAYAVWLYSSPSKSRLVGFVPNLVGKDGKLQTEGKLPADAASYDRLLITLETQSHPRTPGQVVLSGPFREHS